MSQVTGASSVSLLKKKRKVTTHLLQPHRADRMTIGGRNNSKKSVDITKRNCTSVHLAKETCTFE